MIELHRPTQLSLPHVAPSGVDPKIARDGEDPGDGTRRAWIELGSLLPHRNQRALGDLIGFFRRASRVEKAALDARGEVIEKGFKSLTVAARRDASDQFSPFHLEF